MVYVGGITAWSTLYLSEQYKIVNCYNAGKILLNVDSENVKSYIGNIVGVHDKGNIQNCYYIDNGVDGIGQNEDNENVGTVLEVDDENLKKTEMVNRLNDNENEFVFDIQNINNGYPILKYQLVIEKGDVNKNGKIDITDLLMLKRHLVAGNRTDWILAGDNLLIADMNENGSVDITDMLMLKKVVVENI